MQGIWGVEELGDLGMGGIPLMSSVPEHRMLFGNYLVLAAALALAFDVFALALLF